MIWVANLDAEARWRGASLPVRVRRRLAACGLLLHVLAQPGDALELCGPTDAKWLATDWLAPMQAPVGERKEPHFWCHPDAQRFNHRRFFHRWRAASPALAPPGAQWLTRLDALGSLPTPWVLKAPYGAAGRDVVHCAGEADRARAMLQALRVFNGWGAALWEPWLQRLTDYGICARVEGGRVHVSSGHHLLVDEHGRFQGIQSSRDVPQLLVRSAERAGAHLAASGYAGPFGLDAYETREGQFVLSDLNVRMTFGRLAAAAFARAGEAEPLLRTLMMTARPRVHLPAGARPLVGRTTGGEDEVLAWLAPSA